MSEKIVAPGTTPGTYIDAQGTLVSMPSDWTIVPPGDAALTRRIKAAGEYWLIQEKKGRRTFSRGVCAPLEVVETIRIALHDERSTEAFAKQKVANAKRRQVAQEEYVEDFVDAVDTFLAFHPKFQTMAHRLACAVAQHATPVGSGTVARTKRIPIEERARAAVIAWMRHQTTIYDSMKIPRVKGMRREVRRMLAERSSQLLNNYRLGIDPERSCPLMQAIAKLDE